MSHLRTLAAVLLLAQGPTIAWASQADPASQATVRNVMPLSEGWRFHFGDAAGAEAPGFTDDSWTEVSVPHTWNRVGNYLPDPQTTSTPPRRSTRTRVWAGIASRSRRRAITGDQRAWLQFDAASRTAEVWLNGVRLGEHQGGFSRFRFDATDALKPGQANVLVVRTDNTNPTGDSATADILPLRGDFFIHGGLYRPVSLVTTNDVHIDQLDFGGSGIYATTTSIADGRAEVSVRARVRNDGDRPRTLATVAQLVDATGAVAAEAVSDMTVAGGDGGRDRAVPDPSGRAPVAGRRGPVPLHSQGAGPRRGRVGPRSGGSSLWHSSDPHRSERRVVSEREAAAAARGGYHQDREGQGMGERRRPISRRMSRCCATWVRISIRLTHYQHGQVIHDLADRYGLIVWDEIPLVSVWTHGEEMEARPGLVANARQQMTETGPPELQPRLDRRLGDRQRGRFRQLLPGLHHWRSAAVGARSHGTAASN